MSASLQHYPRNPAYGGGVFRRRIVLSADGAHASAELLDDFHEMAMALTVEGGIITDARANMARFPKTTCPGAVTSLAGLRGTPVGDLPAALDRSAHCTHLIDLARLALSQFARGNGVLAGRSMHIR